ncbi:hypothetical protein [Haladaptatus salinisoli]|uniref:hypothetical protein n=1 Tax=Haladaptatus salinisoli TaxID=2884876 RepID=UPI001D0A96BC|nr:hypothetical protein [Haladaptatus salinisoli]
MSSVDGYTLSDFTVTTTTVMPTHSYHLRPSAYFSAEAVADEFTNPTIVDIPTLDNREHRETLQTILQEGEIWTDDIPTGLAELIEETDFFTWDAGTNDVWTHIGVDLYRRSPDTPSALTITAELKNERVILESPGTIEFRVTNRSDEERVIMSGPSPPLSVLWAEADSDDRSFLLWGEYASSGHISFRDGELEVNSVGIGTRIEPGETIIRTYEIRAGTDGLAPGDYVISETLTSRLAEEPPSETIEWTVGFTLTEDIHDEA